MIETTTYRLPSEAPFDNHGKTLAGWVLFWGVCAGLTIVAIGFFTNMGVLIAGGVVTVLAIVASFILRSLGKGQPKGEPRTSDWYA